MCTRLGPELYQIVRSSDTFSANPNYVEMNSYIISVVNIF